MKGTDGVQRAISRGYLSQRENALLPIPFGYSVSDMSQPVEDDKLLVIIPYRIDGRIVTTSKRCAVTPFGSRRRISNSRNPISSFRRGTAFHPHYDASVSRIMPLIKDQLANWDWDSSDLDVLKGIDKAIDSSLSKRTDVDGLSF